MVKALCYWSDGPGIDSRWCHWKFFPWLPPTEPCAWGRLSSWKWVPGISPGVKEAGAYGWRPTTLVVPKFKKIRGLNPPGTPSATSACCGYDIREVTGRRGRSRRKLLDDLKERRERGFSHLKEEALDRTMWTARFRFGRGLGPVVRQTTKWMNMT